MVEHVAERWEEDWFKLWSLILIGIVRWDLFEEKIRYVKTIQSESENSVQKPPLIQIALNGLSPGYLCLIHSILYKGSFAYV